jgi:hypothetical protein
MGREHIVKLFPTECNRVRKEKPVNRVPSSGIWIPTLAHLPHMKITDLLLEVEYPQNAMIRWG